MAPEAENNQKSVTVNIPDEAVKVLTVEEMYDKTKFDLSTMQESDVFKLLK